jgi:hypothetical protein
MADSWQDAEIVTPSWEDAPIVDVTDAKPKTQSEAAGRGLKNVPLTMYTTKFSDIPKAIGSLGETAVNTVGNLGTKAVAGVAGLGMTAWEGISSKSPEAFKNAEGRTNVVEGIEKAGRELFHPRTEHGAMTEDALGATAEKAGQAIKYPLSAVPFAVAGLREGGNTGTEERQKFMKMPMSQYLGELAQDSGASPLLATLAHITPDTVLMATGLKGGKAAAKSATKPSPRAAPTIDELKTQANTLYDVVDNAGIRISDVAFKDAIISIQQNVAQSGARRSLAPKTWVALDELAADAAAGNITLKQVEELRRVLKKAQKGVDADKASATRALREYDKFIENLTPAQLTTGGKEVVEYLKSARSLWSRARKTEKIEDMIDIAGLNAGQYTGSGFENALRLQFRALARKKKEMNMFTAAEQQAIRGVAFGTKTGNILRQIGKLAPTGVVSLGMGSGAGFLIFGPAGAAAVPAVGSLARWGATQSTLKGAEKASELMRAGQ